MYVKHQPVRALDPRGRRGLSRDSQETLITALTTAPALATMDGSLHTLPSKPAAGLDDMDGSLYNLRAFG